MRETLSSNVYCSLKEITRFQGNNLKTITTDSSKSYTRYNNHLIIKKVKISQDISPKTSFSTNTSSPT